LGRSFLIKGWEYMRVKKLIADYASKAVRAMAIKSCGAASAWGSYQPKEPECLKQISKQK